MRGAARVLVAAAVVVGIVSLSGCVVPGNAPVEHHEAKRVAIEGIRGFAAMMAQHDPDGLRAVEVEAELPVRRAGDEADRVEMTLEWGENGVIRRDATFTAHTETQKATIWCVGSYVLYDWDGDVYEERAPRAPGARDPCAVDVLAEAHEAFLVLTVPGAAGLPSPVVVFDDGEVTATFDDGEGSRYVVRHDTSGRVVRVDGAADNMSFVAEAEYARRDTLVPPEATERIPARIETAHDVDPEDGAHRYEVISSWHEPRIEEIEARWVERHPVDPLQPQVWAYALQANDALGDGAVFAYEDRDSDGRVSVADVYRFHPPVPGTSVLTHELVLFDLWANREVNEPVPALPAVVLCAVALAAMAALRRL